MSIDRDMYLEEMERLLADAKLRLLAEWTGEVYTVSVWTDLNAAKSAVCFDTLANSIQQVRKSNKWTKNHYDQYTADGDHESAALFQPNQGRNRNTRRDTKEEASDCIKTKRLPDFSGSLFYRTSTSTGLLVR